MSRKHAIVCGAGGFIGSHLVRRLKNEHWRVTGVDLKYPEFSTTAADEFAIGDLRDRHVCERIFAGTVDRVYQLAADMGGAGYIFTGDNDASVMFNSATINLNVAEQSRKARVRQLFFSSSACVYPAHNQADAENPCCSEDSCYPAAPDSEYGWEKIFGERLYLSYARNYGMSVRIARLHNVFGPEGTWRGGREKAPAAICRKVAEAADDGEIEIWGDGGQTRSFLYIDECLDGVQRLMDGDFMGPVNIGSEEMVTIDELARMAAQIAGKRISVRHVPGPQGVRGRRSDNRLIRRRLNWAPSQPLLLGLTSTFEWINQQVLQNVSHGV